MLCVEPLLMIEEAFELMRIRNECRLMMTNDQRVITSEEQKKWFEQFYKAQNPVKYRVWLLKQEATIGYFAAKECEEGFYITEGIQEDCRGRGAGSFLLKTVLRQENFNKKPLLADILDANLASIHLHRKFGFIPLKKIDQNVTRYQMLC